MLVLSHDYLLYIGRSPPSRPGFATRLGRSACAAEQKEGDCSVYKQVPAYQS